MNVRKKNSIDAEKHVEQLIEKWEELGGEPRSRDVFEARMDRKEYVKNEVGCQRVVINGLEWMAYVSIHGDVHAVRTKGEDICMLYHGKPARMERVFKHMYHYPSIIEHI